MTVRTKSRGQQWTVWLCAALVLGTVYIVLSRCLCDVVDWNPFDVRCHRLMLPLVAAFLFVVRATRWDGVVREGREKSKSRVEGKSKSKLKVEVEERSVANELKSRVEVEERNHHSSTSTSNFDFSQPQPQPSTSSLSGEQLFDRARELPHQPIPDFELDGEYLDLLGKSAVAGYAPAMAKLGDYALRRAAWVEAYYWMTLAKRNGIHGLSRVLQTIRQNWAKDGFSDEIENESPLFPPPAGSLGRALLHLDSGHGAAAARDFLRAHYPDFL